MNCGKKDLKCGGLWRGVHFKGMPNQKQLKKKKIHVVESHCKADLTWLANYTKDLDIASFHVISKCSDSVNGLPPTNSTIEILPNIGRCDHSFAHYITSVLPQKLKGDTSDAIVAFLKDNLDRYPSGFSRSNFTSMVRIASSSNGFACGLVPDSISAFHDKKALFGFQIEEYQNNSRGYV